MACLSQRGSLDGVDIAKFNQCLIGWMNIVENAPQTDEQPSRAVFLFLYFFIFVFYKKYIFDL